MILHSQQNIDNYTAAGWWADTTIRDLWQQQCNAYSERPAVSDPLNRADFTDGPAQQLSYVELGELAHHYAWVLHQSGLGKDDIVAVQLPNIVELVALFLAAQNLGIILSPMPVSYQQKELVQLCNQLEAKALITLSCYAGNNLAAKAMQWQPMVSSLSMVFCIGDQCPEGAITLNVNSHTDSSDKVVKELEDAILDANDVVTICWTSGTESTPKGVPRTHNDWLAISLAVFEAAELSSKDQILCPISIG